MVTTEESFTVSVSNKMNRSHQTRTSVLSLTSLLTLFCSCPLPQRTEVTMAIYL